jgi:hypothetical protein
MYMHDTIEVITMLGYLKKTGPGERKTESPVDIVQAKMPPSAYVTANATLSFEAPNPSLTGIPS